MRLGIITGNVAAWKAGRLWINFANARVYEELGRRFPGARICLPIAPGLGPAMNHALDFPTASIVALPPLRTTLEAQRHVFATRRKLIHFARSVDVLFVRIPFQLPSALFGLGRPKLLHVAGDAREVVRVSTEYRGLSRLLAHAMGWYMERAFASLARESTTRCVTNGESLWEKLGCRRGRIVVSSCLHASEMRTRLDFRLGNPPRLLFVGYLRPEKGVDVLLDAFARLRRERKVRLTVVGAADRYSPSERAVLARIDAHPFAGDIDRTGMIDYGEPLFELYRKHDLFVLPSLSEGTPRTIVEAHAFGCPVVATRVGGVSSSIRDGQDGLLVPPGNAEALARAMRRLLDDGALRLRLIGEGQRRARSESVEHFADILANEIRVVTSAPEAAA